jgi:hypothetical protein
VTITRDFAPADRYLYDFNVLTIAKGWAQLDTRQDAPYFGTWINPTRREIFCYLEGDTILTKCDSDAELQIQLRITEQWNLNQGYRPFRNGKAIGIDPGFSEELKAACVAAGLAEYLHR